MTHQPSARREHVDTQRISDAAAYVFEAVATLEYSGRKPHLAAIADAAGLDRDEVRRTLAALTAEGMLVSDGSPGDEAVYEPARRDWSATPATPSRHPLS